jgi:hypothetical protein
MVKDIKDADREKSENSVLPVLKVIFGYFNAGDKRHQITRL